MQLMAIALAFEEWSGAPTVCATASSTLANEMVREARRYSIPIEESPTLVNTLKGCAVSEEIPESTYREIASLLLKNLLP